MIKRKFIAGSSFDRLRKRIFLAPGDEANSITRKKGVKSVNSVSTVHEIRSLYVEASYTAKSSPRGILMATFTTPTLTITGSTTPGDSIVTVEYEVTFSTFDKASDQPYRESVVLIGDDTPLPNTTLATIVPGFPPFFSVIRASDVVPPATTLRQTHPKTFSNLVLDEDNGTDEIRAVVTLTPVPAAVAGPTESNLVSVTLP